MNKVGREGERCVTEITEYVDPRVLKPDPNQPRQPDWDSEKVREELERLAETFEPQNVINPIEIDENNTIILGERRWRAALLRGLEKVPVRRRIGLAQRERFERQLIDDAQRKQLMPQEKVLAFATGVVNINTDGDYTVSDVKQMYERNPKQLLGLIVDRSGRDDQGRQKRMGQSLLAQRIGISQPRVSQFLSWFKVGPEMQDAFMAGEVSIEYVWRVASLFDNNNLERTEQQIRIERKILSGEIESSDQLAVIINETRKQIEKRRVEVAKEIIPEIVPEVKKPETPEEFEEAAKALRKRAKELKSPEQLLNEKQEKARKALLSEEGDVLLRVEKAKEMGIDTTEFEERIEKIEAKITDDPDEVLKETRRLKGEIDEAINGFEEEEKKRRLEEEIKTRIEVEKKRFEEEIMKEVEEVAKVKAREELMKDQEFLREVAETVPQKRPLADWRGKEIPARGPEKEIVTEDLWECPICHVRHRLIHLKPSGHKLEEIRGE